MSDYVEISIAAGVATIRFNRPEKRNAISQDMWLDLLELVEHADRAEEVGVIVITGSGGHFISGADLDERETVHASSESTLRYLNMTSAVMRALASAKKATVAKIEGACMGAGCLIALTCDLRFATDTSRYSVPPSKLGLMCPLEDTKRIVDVVGPAVAKDLLFSARVIHAQEALQVGLLNAIFPVDQFEEEIQARVRGILANSQWSVGKTKAIVSRILAGETEDTDETRGWLRDALGGADFKEGQTAFKERRPPKFTFS
jgi:enoyl-CoA hydratase/carnithine racemase